MKSHLSRGRMLRDTDQFFGLLTDLSIPTLTPDDKKIVVYPWEWELEYRPTWDYQFLGLSFTLQDRLEELGGQWDDGLGIVERLYPYNCDPCMTNERWPEYYFECHNGVNWEEEECKEEEEWTTWWTKNN